MLMRFLKIVCGLILILGLIIIINAQNKHETILKGVVMDGLGSVLPKAQIIALGKNGKKIEAVTDANGVYGLSLSKGIYTIQIKREPFKTFIIKEYQIAYGNQKMQLDVSLICEDCLPIEDSSRSYPKRLR